MGEDNGTPLQYFCLENPMDGGAMRHCFFPGDSSETHRVIELHEGTEATFAGVCWFGKNRQGARCGPLTIVCWVSQVAQW